MVSDTPPAGVSQVVPGGSHCSCVTDPARPLSVRLRPENRRKDVVQYGWSVWGCCVLSVTSWVWAIVAQGQEAGGHGGLVAPVEFLHMDRSSSLELSQLMEVGGFLSFSAAALSLMCVHQECPPGRDS